MQTGLDLSDVASTVLKFRSDRDWEQFHTPKNLATGLAIEAAELQEVFLWQDNLTTDAVLNDEVRVQAAREEIADITVYLLMLANDLNINLADAVASKLEDNARRYPAEEYRGRSDKAPH
jgi:NTP pyrophosphatase (non-canonical NTP hydrolase)